MSPFKGIISRILSPVIRLNPMGLQVVAMERMHGDYKVSMRLAFHERSAPRSNSLTPDPDT